MAKNTIPTRPTPPKGHTPERTIDPEKLLTEEKKAELREAAQRKIMARDIADAEEQYLKEQMELADKAKHPEIFEEMREIRLDLALYADRVILDGRAYFADESYTVTKRVYDVLKECEQASYRHDNEIKSGDTNDSFYRKQRAASTERRMSFKTGAVETVPLRF